MPGFLALSAKEPAVKTAGCVKSRFFTPNKRADDGLSSALFFYASHGKDKERPYFFLTLSRDFLTLGFIGIPVFERSR